MKIVVDSNNHWLYYGNGTKEEAIEEAKRCSLYDSGAELYVYEVEDI